MKLVPEMGLGLRGAHRVKFPGLIFFYLNALFGDPVLFVWPFCLWSAVCNVR